MIQLQSIEHGYSGKILFKNLSFTFKFNKKVALVGSNGVGKTTLFRLIKKNESVLKGDIIVPKNCTIEYLAQEVEFGADESVIELTLSAFKDLFLLEKEIESLNQQLSEEKGQKKIIQISHKIEKFQHRLSVSDFYQLEATAKKILAGLGFPEREFDRSISEFSGGWKMRALLAKMLLSEPDFLLLDEPTNHLDIESLTWLEDYLTTYSKSVIIISHDQSFLDRIVSEVVELSNKNLTRYIGNYTDFCLEKEERLLSLAKTLQQKQKQIQHIQEFVDRFRYKATKAKQVQSRIKMLEKMNVDAVKFKEKHVAFAFQVTQPSSKLVFSFKNLQMKFSKKDVLNEISGEIYRGDRIAIMGSNGAGKSTFVRLLSKRLKATSGYVESNETVRIAYYSQHQLEELGANNTVYQELMLFASDEKRNQVRSILGAFLFSGEDIEKKISVLSGGEKARVALAKILVQPVNTLILDEPTNHLDVDSKERLQMALMNFDGTCLIISHDRSFLDGLIKEVYYFYKGDLCIYTGEINEIQSWIEEIKYRKVYKKNEQKKTAYIGRKKERNALKRIEKEIESVEAELDALERKKKKIQRNMNFEKDYIKLMAFQSKFVFYSERELELMNLWERKNEEFDFLKAKNFN